MRPEIRWQRSFRFAYEGIKYALITQPNMKFHFLASFVALISAVFFQLPKEHILFILLAVTLVIVCELVNTAVEKTVDLAMPDRHPLAKIAKDVAAAAVLVAAVFAAAVGMIVFYEPVSRVLRGLGTPRQSITPAAVWVYFVLVALTVIVAETRFTRSRRFRPSLWMTAAFSISTLIALLAADPLVIVLAYTLSGLFLVGLYLRRGRSLVSLLFGAVFGSTVTLLVYQLHMWTSIIRLPL